MPIPLPHGPSPVMLAFVPLMVWRMVARFRRQIGRQRSSSLRHKIPLFLFPSLLLLLGAVTPPLGETALFLGGSALCGVLLAQMGLRLTRFEPTRQGLFYTPHAYLGITLSLLFASRITYRILQLTLFEPQVGQPANYLGGAATLLIFGLLAGYNTAYAFGLLRWRRDVIARARSRG